MADLEEVGLLVEEAEAIRLKDLEPPALSGKNTDQKRTPDRSQKQMAIHLQKICL